MTATTPGIQVKPASGEEGSPFGRRCIACPIPRIALRNAPSQRAIPPHQMSHYYGPLVLLLVLMFLAVPFPVLACGAETDCDVGERSYRITLPETPPAGKKVGAILYVHGYRGKAARVMKHKGLLRAANELGVAFIAAQSHGDDWSIPGAPTQSVDRQVDELAYFEAVVDDVEKRFPIDRNRLLVTGFSAGGMMVWNLACDRPDLFTGFVPMSGTFWRPIPETCAGAPVNLFHYHGTGDQIVPLKGRPVADTHQGDVWKAAALLMRDGKYTPFDDVPADEGLDCRRGRANHGRKIFDVCLHDGKHMFQSSFIRRSWKILTEIGAL